MKKAPKAKKKQIDLGGRTTESSHMSYSTYVTRDEMIDAHVEQIKQSFKGKTTNCRSCKYSIFSCEHPNKEIKLGYHKACLSINTNMLNLANVEDCKGYKVGNEEELLTEARRDFRS